MASDGFVYVQPELEPRGGAAADAKGPMAKGSWETPGTVLADRLAGCSAVRAVYERLEPDRYALFVILDQDDEPTLDLVFEAEKELFRAFSNMPFDLRVMRPSATWDAEAMRAFSTAHYERA
jgi:hypothetical protein